MLFCVDCRNYKKKGDTHLCERDRSGNMRVDLITGDSVPGYDSPTKQGAIPCRNERYNEPPKGFVGELCGTDGVFYIAK